MQPCLTGLPTLPTPHSGPAMVSSTGPDALPTLPARPLPTLHSHTLPLTTLVLQSLLDMMVAEEESLKERLLKSIALCRKELDTLCRELQLGPFEVRCGMLGSCWQ